MFYLDYNNRVFIKTELLLIFCFHFSLLNIVIKYAVRERLYLQDNKYMKSKIKYLQKELHILINSNASEEEIIKISRIIDSIILEYYYIE